MIFIFSNGMITELGVYFLVQDILLKSELFSLPLKRTEFCCGKEFMVILMSDLVKLCEHGYRA